MKKFKTFIFFSILSIFLYFFHYDGFAEEVERTLSDFELKSSIKIICPPDVSKSQLNKIKKIGVLVKSTSPLFGEVAEDQLAIKLRDKGFDVMEQSKISELALNEAKKRELQKIRELLEIEKQLEKVDEKLKEFKRLEKQLEEVGDKPQKEVLNIIDVGKTIGLDAVIIGNLFEGRRQLSFAKAKPPRIVEKMVVSTFFLKVIDIETEKVVLTLLIEYSEGENIKKAIDTMANYFLETIRENKNKN
jgi:hypothetical protein